MPTIAGLTIIWLMFGIMGLYVFLNRATALKQICLYPLFLASYVFLIVGSLLECVHPEASFFEIFRITEMVIGAIFVASLCRDRQALWTAMVAIVVTGVWLSIITGSTSYGILSSAQVSSYSEATYARNIAAGNSAVEVNENAVGATAARGAVVALVFALAAVRRRRVYLSWASALICLLGVFLSVSRSGVINVILSTVAVMFATGFKNRKVILVVAVCLVTMILLVPQAVWYRMSFSTETNDEGMMEARARIYTTTIEYLPEYLWLGVGSGNFWGPWGSQSEFFGKHTVLGSHNGLIQVTIYWGLAGLIALLWLIWRAYLCLPKHNGKDPLALSLGGVSLSLLLLLLAQHNLYSKEFAIGLGLLAGSQRWIWSQGVVPPVSRRIHRSTTFTKAS